MSLRVAARASERERAHIEALATRYASDPKARRRALDAAYAQAMGRVAARFPDDLDIAVLYAEALMDLSLWDSAQADRGRSKGRIAAIVKTLERVLAKNPDHPGAIHYYLHTVAVPTAPRRAERYAERLAALMPGAGHLVHMAAHVYNQVGRYLDALAVNRAAITVDEAYLARARPAGIYPERYYPHHIHSLLVSAQMAGDGETTLAAAEKLERTVSDEAVRASAPAQPMKAAPYFAHVQFSTPERVLALPSPGAEFPYVKAMWHYARGVAYAAQGRIEAAQGEARAITTLSAQANFKDLSAAGVPAQDILGLAHHVVLGRIAQARGDRVGAASEFEVAAAIQDRLPARDPPYWYYPVHQSLGAVWLLAGELAPAEQCFRVALARTPNNGRARRRGDIPSLRTVEGLLAKSWAGDGDALDLDRL
ncbi:MAG: hypothetical protein ACT4QB_06095 [Gammaproteobacteria bacterium]